MTDYHDIERRMQVYFDGLYFGDTDRLADVLHPDARYICASEAKLINLSMNEYLPIVAKRPSPASRGEPRRDSIVSIAFAGPKTAVVRAHCAVGERYFTDLLTFILDGNTWRIIAKVFHFDLVSETPAGGV